MKPIRNRKFSNNSTFLTLSDMSAIQTTLSLSPQDIATLNSMLVTVDDHIVATISDTTNIEIIELSKGTGGTVDMLRAREATSSFLWPAGSSLTIRITSDSLDQFRNNILYPANALTMLPTNDPSYAGDINLDNVETFYTVDILSNLSFINFVKPAVPNGLGVFFKSVLIISGGVYTQFNIPEIRIDGYAINQANIDGTPPLAGQTIKLDVEYHDGMWTMRWRPTVN